MEFLTLALREWRFRIASPRLWAAWALTAALFALAAPFGLGEAYGPADRLVYWLVALGAAWAVGTLAGAVTETAMAPLGASPLSTLAVTVAMSAPVVTLILGGLRASVLDLPYGFGAWFASLPVYGALTLLLMAKSRIVTGQPIGLRALDRVGPLVGATPDPAPNPAPNPVPPLASTTGEATRPNLRQADLRQADPRQADPRQAESPQVEPRQVESPQSEPRQVGAAPADAPAPLPVAANDDAPPLPAAASPPSAPPPSAPPPSAPPPSAAPSPSLAAKRPDPRLLLRLPVAKRAPLLRLSMNDHYVSVATEAGEELVLMRLGDAMAEARPEEGLRVHRSHWVARRAVRAVRRDGDRATLTLANGEEIPVSRARLRDLRAAGWLDEPASEPEPEPEPEEASAPRPAHARQAAAMSNPPDRVTGRAESRDDG